MTDLTAEGEGSGWGFQRSLKSKWFAFQNNATNHWLKANKEGKIEMFNGPKPGAWEKF